MKSDRKKSKSTIPFGLAKIEGRRISRTRIGLPPDSKGSLDSNWNELLEDQSAFGNSFRKSPRKAPLNRHALEERQSLPKAPRRQSLKDVANYGENGK